MSITVSKEEVIGFEKLKAISQIAPIEKEQISVNRCYILCVLKDKLKPCPKSEIKTCEK
jgi:hypothetical protein